MFWGREFYIAMHALQRKTDERRQFDCLKNVQESWIKWERNLICSRHSQIPLCLDLDVSMLTDVVKEDISASFHLQHTVSYFIEKYSKMFSYFRDVSANIFMFSIQCSNLFERLNNIKMMIKLRKRKHLFLTRLKHNGFIQSWLLRTPLWNSTWWRF